MKKSRTQIRMMRTVHAGAFLVVEGASDMRFWWQRKHVGCELVDGEGKSNVVGSIQRLDARGFVGVLGVVDDDYDSLMGMDTGSDNVVRTDAHDLECLLCRSGALEAVLAEFGVPLKIRRFGEDNSVDVRTGLVDRALIFGRLRWAAVRHNLAIDSAAIRVQRFVDIDTWQVDSAALIRVVTASDFLDDEGMIAKRIAQLPPADSWRVVHGHDMVEILRRGLMRILGDITRSVGPKQITQVLRAGMSTEEFQATTLCADIRSWETANDGYPVLRD